MNNDLLADLKTLTEKKKERIAKILMTKIFVISLSDSVNRFNYKTGEVFSKIQAYALIKGAK